MHGVSVSVRFCHNFSAAQVHKLGDLPPYMRNTADIQAIYIKRLLMDYHVRKDGHTPSLEFVPLACIGQNTGAFKGRPHSFTVNAGYYGLDGQEILSRSLMCKDESTPDEPKVVLMVDGPSCKPTWHGPGENLVHHAVASAPPVDAPIRLFQLPYPSIGGWDGGTMLPTAPAITARTALAAAFFNDHWASGWPLGRSPLRRMLLSECEGAGRGTCLMMPANASRVRDGAGALGRFRDGWGSDPDGSERSARAVKEAYQSAKFCLQPWGDLGTRKGYWDAISAGCIPAVFTECAFNETDAWFGDHRLFSVRVPLEELGPGRAGALGFLGSISTARVEALHQAVLAVRERVSYASARGSRGDAVDVSVEALLRHFGSLRPSSHQQYRAAVNTHFCRSYHHPSGPGGRTNHSTPRRPTHNVTPPAVQPTSRSTHSIPRRPMLNVMPPAAQPVKVSENSDPRFSLWSQLKTKVGSFLQTPPTLPVQQSRVHSTDT